MTDSQLSALLVELCSLPAETEWVEFKVDVTDPIMIGERISALANSAALEGKPTGYVVWGVENGTHAIVGTTFDPERKKKGDEALVNWLTHVLVPKVDCHFWPWMHEGHRMVLLEIPAATYQPIRFSNEEHIRIGSHTKRLREFPTKEAQLWATFNKSPFEIGIAKADVAGDEVLSLLDFTGCFDLLKITLPTDQTGILARLAEEKLIVERPGRRFDITNLGAILFAKNLRQFDRLARKALRVVKYRGRGRTETEREWQDAPSQHGYAVAFDAAVAFINSQLPQNEAIGQAFRTEVRMYPERAIRELVANALIHQDFSIRGAGPMVEIFDDRMEITNPGEPLVDTKRFIDLPPRSRNEELGATMRRARLCEELGTGVDKVIEDAEHFQLPAPDFRTITATDPGSTQAVLYAPRKLRDLGPEDRVRACYQHACLFRVSGRMMSNATLRERLGVTRENYPAVSRIIKETVDSGLIRAFDPFTSKRYMQYVPFWA